MRQRTESDNIGLEKLRHEKWAGTTYGNGWMHRWLIRFLKAVDVRCLYAFTRVAILPVTVAVNVKARRTIYRFYREGFGWSRGRCCRMVWRNFRAFSEVVIDRFAMYAGRRFEISIDGYDEFLRLCDGEEGFVQLSSHIGNYELAGYSLRSDRKRMNALVFGGEKESVMANRARLFGDNNIRMIPMGGDMQHIFTIDHALAEGEILSMPADRVFGSQKAFTLPFLGHEATFPQGPFLMAATRGVPMLFVAVMKNCGGGYDITVRRLPQSEARTTREKAHALASAYAQTLEDVVKRYPEQWYNYFDFWTH